MSLLDLQSIPRVSTAVWYQEILQSLRMLYCVFPLDASMVAALIRYFFITEKEISFLDLITCIYNCSGYVGLQCTPLLLPCLHCKEVSTGLLHFLMAYLVKSELDIGNTNIQKEYQQTTVLIQILNISAQLLLFGVIVSDKFCFAKVCVSL